VAAQGLFGRRHVGLIEQPEDAAHGQIGIGDHAQSLVVTALGEHGGHDALVDEALHHGLERRPVELAKVGVGHEAVGALVQDEDDERGAGHLGLAHAPVDDYGDEPLTRLQDLLGPAEAVDHDALGAAQRVGQHVVGGLGETPERRGDAQPAGDVGAGGPHRHQIRETLTSRFGHPLHPLHHRRVGEGRQAEEHGGGLHHVGEGRKPRQGREGRPETR